jgi:hypothetical protein
MSRPFQFFSYLFSELNEGSLPNTLILLALVSAKGAASRCLSAQP